MGDNTLSQIHHNGALQKGKAIAKFSAEIKIVITGTKTPTREFPLEVISCLIELLCQRLTWNYPQPMDGHRLVPTLDKCQFMGIKERKQCLNSAA